MMTKSKLFVVRRISFVKVYFLDMRVCAPSSIYLDLNTFEVLSTIESTEYEVYVVRVLYSTLLHFADLLSFPDSSRST